MKFKIQNLGPIRNASIDLNKKLTVFCGPNNTGKTYISYIIYALTNNKPNSGDKLDHNNIQKLLKKQPINISVNSKKLFAYRKLLSNTVRRKIDTVFGIADEMKEALFKDVKIDFLTSEDECASQIKKAAFENTIKLYGLEYTIIKKANQGNVQIIPPENNELPEKHLFPFIFMTLPTLVYNRLAIYPIFNSFIFPVERIAIYTFKTELSLSRNALIDQMQKLTKNKGINPFDLIEQGSKRYPQAIKDGLYVANDLTNIQKNKTPYYELAQELEKDVLEGTLSVDKNGDVQFVPNKTNKTKKLPIHFTASSVKSMSSLIFYLKHLADKDQLIIIDEPEMNLHPDNQIKLVNIFAKMVNKGLRLLISTHSDYITREINNLIMASAVQNHVQEVRKRLEISDECILRQEDVGIYYFNYVTRTKVDVKEEIVDDAGFKVDSMDDAIQDQNHKAEELYYALKYGEDE